jgi:type I restriction enzyme, S subunit
MTNWTEYKLSDLMQIKYGKDHKHLADGPFPLYGSGGIMRYVAKPLYSEASILIPRKGTLSNLFYLDKPFWSVDTMFYSIINKQLALPKYLYYTLKTFDLASLNVGSAVPSLTTEVLNDVLVSVPDINTQTAIAEILSSLDDKIELNNKINQELENLAQTLFKQWFIDFEFPNENGEPYKSSVGEMVDSELGEIPKGWVVKSLDEVAEYLNGLALQKFPPKNENDYLPVIKIRELRQGITQASDKASTEVPEKYIIQNGDVLFAWSGSLMIDFWTNGEGALNQHLFKVTSENYPKWFYFYWTKYHLDEFIKIAESKATTMGHIQRKHLTEAKVSVPISEQLNQFNDNFENIVVAIISNRIENQELANLRDTLLHKLILGKLEVKNVKI